jgi:CheY-like chemotaxis protein
VPATAALAGLPIQGARGLEQVRLSAIVAATTRAALDLALGDEAPRRLAAAWDDGALELTCPLPAAGDLAAAAALLETVDGSLGRTEDGQAWTARVPVLGARTLFLMLRQGTLPLAVPWHAVLRVRLATRPALEAMARRAGSTVLAPFVSVSTGPAERPAVLVANGLRRAFLVADLLVWRMPAEPVETDESAPAAPLVGTVRTSEGEVYWVADPALLLREVDPPPLPAPARRAFTPRPMEPSAAAPPRPASPAAPTPAAPASPESSAAAPPRPQLVELRRQDVEPLFERPAPPPPAPVPARRALVAEDSLVGRVFLQRLLELRGYQVEGVGTAGELERDLGRGPWALVLADVELPDSTRGEHLARAREACAAAGWPLAALVRDAADESVARAAGVLRSLRKPFEQEHLQRLLGELGPEAPR